MKKLLILFWLVPLINLYSCGLAYKKHIIGRYYIIGVDTKTDLSLSYYENFDFYIGKAPGTLLQYGFNDTFLVAKTTEYTPSDPSYYIIDMTKDSELAHEETFRIGPLTEEEYNLTWKQRLKLRFKAVR